MESVENPRPTNPNDTDDGSDALPAYLREPLPADPSLREAKELEERYAELLAHFEMLEAYEKNLKANVDVEEQKLRQLTETLTSAQEANAARRSQIFVERNNILLLEEQIRSTTEQRVAAEEQNANDKAQLEDDEKRAKEQAAEIEAMVAKAEEIRTTSPWIQDLNAAEESLKQQRAELETLEAEKASWEARLEAAQTTIKLHEEFPGFDFFTETAQLVEKVVTLRHQIYDETSRANAALKVKEMEGISSQASQSPSSSPTRPPPNVEINESPNNTDDVESASSTALATPVTVSPSPSPSREEDEPAQPIETPLSKASKLPVRKTPSGLHQPPSPNCPVPRSVLKKTTQYPAPPLSTPQQLQKTKNAHVQDYLEEQEENVVGSADSRQPKPRVRIVVNEPEEVSEEAPPVQEEEDIGDAASQSDFEANSDEMPVGTATHGDEPEESNETVEENPSAFGHQTILQSPAQYEDEEEPMEAEQQEDEEEEERDEGMEDDGEEGYEETGSQNADLLSASLVVPEEEEDGTGEEGEQVVDVPPIPPPSSRFQAPIAPAARPMPIPSAPVAASAAKKPVAPIDPSTILNISVNSVDPGGDFLAMMQVANDNQPAIQVGGGMTPEHGDSATDFMALFGGPSGGGGGDALMEGVVSGADTGMGGVFDFGFGGSGFGMDMDNTAMNGAAGGASSGNDAAGGSFNFSFNFP